MYRLAIASVLAGLMSATASTGLAHPGERFVELQVIDASGRAFDIYPARSESPDVVRTYLQAERGAAFRLRVRNPHDERIGVLIAVDGRNIISGKRSALAASEPLYIVDARRTQVFSGWRTDADHVHAFYFTDAGDSYAAAWDDYSAMGTIAVVAFRERRVAGAQPYGDSKSPRRAPSSQSPAASAQGERSLREADETQAGTGFGERQWSRARRVRFAASERAAFRHIVKYEWRSALCRRGVIPRCREPNRLWPELGYAPYPPAHPRPRW